MVNSLNSEWAAKNFFFNCISYILLLTNYPKTKWAETSRSIYYLTCSMGQTFGSNLAQWFGLRVSNVVQVKIIAWLGLENQLLRWLTHIATSRRLRFLAIRLLEHLHKMAASSRFHKAETSMSFMPSLQKSHTVILVTYYCLHW